MKIPLLLIYILGFFCTHLHGNIPKHFHEAAANQLKSMQYADVTHPKLIIFFSGVPGMGKTTVATALENKLKALRISSDEARAHLRNALGSQGNDASIQLEEYLEYLLKEVTSSCNNHLIIIDRSIDGIDSAAFALASRLNYPTFVIRLTLPKEKVIERLEKREQNPEIHNIRLQRIDKWFTEYNSFPLEKVDYTLGMNNFSEDPNCYPMVSNWVEEALE